MKATEQYFLVVQSVMLYKAVLTSQSMDEIVVLRLALEHYFHVVSLVSKYFTNEN